MNTIFQERLKYAMHKQNKSQADLCRETGIISAAMSSYYNGRYEPKPENGELLAKALNVSYSWLMGIDDNPKRHAPRSAVDAGVATNEGPVRIPVVSEIAGGVEIEAMNYCIDNDDPDTWEEIPREWLHGDKQFIALRVSGVSMEPLIHDGSIVIIERCYEWHNGEIMAVYVNGYNGTLKLVHLQSNGILTLEAYNKEIEEPTRSFTPEERKNLPVTPFGVLREVRYRPPKRR